MRRPSGEAWRTNAQLALAVSKSGLGHRSTSSCGAFTCETTNPGVPSGVPGITSPTERSFTPGISRSALLAARREALALSWTAPDLLALFGMLILAIAETGRIPVDNPDTHLELTMLHEGMLLEHSGPGLACILLATHVKQLVTLLLVAALFLPLGLARGSAPPELALALAAFAVKVLLLATFLGLVESSYAKLRFFRVPQFLGLGLVCAFLALALRVL